VRAGDNAGSEEVWQSHVILRRLRFDLLLDPTPERTGQTCQVPERRRRYGSDVTVLGRACVVTAAALCVAIARVAVRARAVAVSGPSMVPTFTDGDALVVYPVRRVRPGDVVIARFRSRPDLLVVKRAIRPYRDGWWLEGDNPYVTDDSRKYGEAVVLGRVLFRYWRGR